MKIEIKKAPIPPVPQPGDDDEVRIILSGREARRLAALLYVTESVIGGNQNLISHLRRAGIDPSAEERQEVLRTREHNFVPAWQIVGR